MSLDRSQNESLQLGLFKLPFRCITRPGQFLVKSDKVAASQFLFKHCLYGLKIRVFVFDSLDHCYCLGKQCLANMISLGWKTSHMFSMFFFFKALGKVQKTWAEQYPCGKVNA